MHSPEQIRNMEGKLPENSDCFLIRLLLFGAESFNLNNKIKILNATNEFTLSYKRFDELLLKA